MSLFELLVSELLDPLLSPRAFFSLDSLPRGGGAASSVLGILYI
jgi:hypothetical protein